MKIEYWLTSARPIKKYNDKENAAFNPSNHAIIHLVNQLPGLEPTTDMTKEPLALVPASSDQYLDPLSCVDFGKVHVIERLREVIYIGQLTEKSLKKLRSYWRNTIGQP